MQPSSGGRGLRASSGRAFSFLAWVIHGPPLHSQTRQLPSQAMGTLVDQTYPEVASVHLFLAHLSPQRGPSGWQSECLENQVSCKRHRADPEVAALDLVGSSSPEDLPALFSWLARQVGEIDFLVWCVRAFNETLA